MMDEFRMRMVLKLLDCPSYDRQVSAALGVSNSNEVQ
jgi:hypothetical protein